MSDYPGNNEPTRPMPRQGQQQWPAQPVPGRTPQAQHEYAEPRRSRRFPLKTTIAIVVLLLLLVGADRVAAAITEDKMASQVQTSMHLSGKPNVSIQGFPFLTQLIGRNLHTVVITGHNLTDGQLDLADINATARGMHIHGLSSATIDSITGSVTITLSSLANAGGVPASVTLKPAGGNTVDATISVLGASATATATVTEEAGNKIHVHVTNAAGVPASVLGSFSDFTVSVPNLPAGVNITNVTVTSAGIQVNFNGSNTTFSQ
jgi:hypothetical protein